MAETVYLLDGSMEVILTDKAEFLERLIREKLGDDACRCFTDYLTEIREELEYSQECNSENEHSADGYMQMCHDAMDGFQELLSYLDAPRIDRQKLKAKVKENYDRLYKNL